MIFEITIYYKNKDDYMKIIKIPLNSQIKVLKDKDMYIITLSNDIDTHLYKLKEEEINGFEIRRIN